MKLPSFVQESSIFNSLSNRRNELREIIQTARNSTDPASHLFQKNQSENAPQKRRSALHYRMLRNAILLMRRPTRANDKEANSLPEPKIDVSNQIEVIKSTIPGTFIFQYLNSGEVHGISGVVNEEGTLSFDIRAWGDRSTLGSGRDMFRSLMKRIAQEGITVKEIEVSWEFTQGKDSNTQKFVENLMDLMSPEDAAKNTWNGKVAAEVGFTHVRSVKRKEDGNYLISFIKP